MHSVWVWILFNAFVLLMLALDLGVFHRKAHVVSVREALIWTFVWVALALIFNIGVWHFMGSEAGLQFLTGYIIEKSLSVDNIFVILLIFSTFGVPAMFQHRVLFWGILGALVMRGMFIYLGAVLIAKFHWIIYLFGAFLIFTGFRMAFLKEKEPNPELNWFVLLVKRFYPVTPGYEGKHFFVRREGRWFVTPLFLVLVLIESTDLIFAVDSIPAIFAVTQDPFLVYTSNIFAILGLRSLYFALAGMVEKFIYLKTALSFILSFVGVKMVMMDIRPIPTPVSLGVILSSLLFAVIASIIRNRRGGAEAGTKVKTPG